MAHQRLSKGDVVLVTGASGLLGASVSDELLKRGLKVKGVTRDASKETLLKEKFDRIYGSGNFEWLEIQDATKEGAYKEALKGVSGIIHAATDASFSSDYSQVVDTAVGMTLGILKSARELGTVKSAVVTSSCVAVYIPAQEKDVSFTVNDWNDQVVQLAQQAPADDPQKPFFVYMASKTRAERELWKFVQEQKPSFAVNTILPVMIVGPRINPADRVYSSSTWTKQVFDHNLNNFAWTMLHHPSNIIDVRDCAILHVAALLDPETKSERLWASSFDVTWNDVYPVWQKAHPDHKLPTLGEVVNSPRIKLDTSRSDDLLKRFAGRSYIPFQQSYLDNVKDSD